MSVFQAPIPISLTGVSPGQALYINNNNNPVWDRRIILLQSDVSYSTSGSAVATATLTPGVWFMDLQGWYWGSVAASGIGVFASFTGTASAVVVNIDVTRDTGNSDRVFETTSFNTRIGTGGEANISRFDKRRVWATVNITVTVAGTLTLNASAGTGTTNLSRGTCVRWDQIA